MRSLKAISGLSLMISLGMISACSSISKTGPASQPINLMPAPQAALSAGISAIDWQPVELPEWARLPLLSPGDRIQIDISDGDQFNGRYEIDVDGAIRLPHLAAIEVAGHSIDHLEQRLAEALVQAEFFKPHRLQVSARVHEWSHVQVYVSGAVYSPGKVTVNARKAEERALKQSMQNGDFPSERLLDAALRAAGGIRPDAAIDRIRLIRQQQVLDLDYRGLMQGLPAPAVPLMSGDIIIVPDSGFNDDRLVSLSAITPPGIRVFLSNLTMPAQHNSGSAIGKETTSLPYGSRLLTAAVSANCVGGARSTNAGRYVVMIRDQADPNREQVVERAVEALVDAPADEHNNPVLLPNDNIACYDSGVTNLREIMRSIYEFILPIKLL